MRVFGIVQERRTLESGNVFLLYGHLSALVGTLVETN